MSYKKELNGYREVLDYMMSINDNMDEEFLEDFIVDNYGQNCKALLKEITVSEILPRFEQSHILDDDTQKKYNSSQGEFNPIILSNDLKLIDGHHRYRASLFQKRSLILAYVLHEESE